MSDVLLIVPPMLSMRSACDGTSMLKAVLAQAGIGCDVLYLNVRFAEAIGERLYLALSESVKHHNSLVGEWLFAGEVFDDATPNPEAYLQAAQSGAFGPPYRYSRRSVERLRAARATVPAFLDDLMAEIPWDRYRVIGSVSGVAMVRMWVQILPIMAVFRRLRERQPAITTLVGGPHCDGEPGAAIARLFPWVSYVCPGEVERTAATLVRRLLTGPAAFDGESRDPSSLPVGVIRGGRSSARPTTPVPTPYVLDLNRLPYPDYADYYAQTHEQRARGAFQTLMPFEASRGCWWGEKHHCTFCGLNGEGMVFRSKTPERAAEELDALATSWGAERVQVLDKILSPAYLDTFVEVLARREQPLDLFFAAKANLTREQLRKLARAGIRTLQPGIESLSTPILRRMDKGTTLLQNVRLLKWCAEVGIRPIWNILYGTASEDPAEYARMAALVPSLTHLEPPASIGLIHLHRFSPELDRAEERGLVNVRAAAPYRYVYPFPGPDLDQLAQRLDFAYADGRDPERYTADLRAVAAPWLAGRDADRSHLTLRDLGDRIEIADTRPIAVRPLTVLQGPARLAYLALDEGTTVAGVQAALTSQGPDAPSEHIIAGWLNEWLDARLILQEGQRYLSLAVDPTLTEPSGRSRPPAHSASVRSIGARDSTPSLSLPPGMVPISLSWQRQRVRLLDLRGAQLREPTFGDTVQRWRQQPPEKRSVTMPFEQLLAAAEHERLEPPAGFVFHVGRCGSTLLARMLAVPDNHVVVKESSTVSLLLYDAANAAKSDDSRQDDAARLLAAIVPLLARGAAASPSRLFLKLMSWDILMVATLRRVFPTTPAVFLYRDAHAVVASLLEVSGLIDLPPDSPGALQRAQLLEQMGVPPDASEAAAYAHVWRATVQAALDLPADWLLTLDYADLAARPEQSLARVLAHFGLPPGPEMLAAMGSVAPFYSKGRDAQAVFDPAGAHYRSPLTPEQHAQVSAVIGDLPERLAAHRASLPDAARPRPDSPDPSAVEGALAGSGVPG
jgi:ribosomal peptide maturation radical SAM protein 1